MSRNIPDKYKGTVTEIRPLFQKRTCDKCKRDFNKSIGWKIHDDISREIILCQICCPNMIFVEDYCKRVNLEIKEVKNIYA